MDNRLSLISIVVIDIWWYDTERHGYHNNSQLKYTSQTLICTLYIVNGDVLKGLTEINEMVNINEIIC